MDCLYFQNIFVIVLYIKNVHFIFFIFKKNLKLVFCVSLPDYSSTKAPEPAFVGDIARIKVKAGNDAVLRCVVENLGDLKVYPI